MRVAVSADGDSLDAQLDPRFGRCRFFMIVNPDDLSFEAFNNESADQGGGAGVRAARLIASHGVEAVITGNCGPNAGQTLAAAGIELFDEQSGTVREVIERYKNGYLKSIDKASVNTDLGVNTAVGSVRKGGAGSGGGIGRGMGGRRGTGRGRGLCGTAGPVRMAAGPQSKDQELESLRRQADSLNKRMKNVISRINTLENQ